MRIDHFSCRIRDPQTTHAFYTEVLGLTLTHAFTWEELMLVYEIPGGGRIAFTTGAPERRSVPEEHWEEDHFGVSVDSVEALNQIVTRAQQRGITSRVHPNERIYLQDPDGLIIEVEVDEPWKPDPDAFEKLRRWPQR